MEVKEGGEISTNLKFGLAVALSLGGALYSYHRIKNIKFPPGYSRHVDSRIENGQLKNDDRYLQNPMSDEIYPKKEVEEEDKEREIRRLRNRVIILEEKERILEMELLEYYGIKEQENSAMELQNRLRLNTMEAKLYNLKMESLLLDNRRLEAQAADCADSSAELEAAKSKIKMLRKKLKSEGERNKEQILKLQDRLRVWQEQEKKNAEMGRDLKIQLEEAFESKLELEEMKKGNEILKLENIELAQKLEYVQMLAQNAVDNDELQEVKEESERLKQENEESKDEVERLKAERNTDQEELIFLRWINACLRNELKNYQPASKSIARNLSPKSEERAKKLILEYANREAKPIDSNFLESDQWSSPCMTEDREELPAGDLTPSPSSIKAGKPKLFGKLRRLLLGKTTRRQTPPLDRTQSVDAIPARLSCDFPAGSPRVVDAGGEQDIKVSRILSRSGSRRSFDVPRSYSRGTKSMAVGGTGSRLSNAEDSTSIINRIAEFDSTWSPALGALPLQADENASKEEMLKFAEAWKDSRSSTFESS